jgi:hypothetical protein
MTKPTSTKPKVWSETIIPDKPDKKCDHHFQFTDNGECRCRYCGLGLIGVIDLVEGKPV